MDVHQVGSVPGSYTADLRMRLDVRMRRWAGAAVLAAAALFGTSATSQALLVPEAPATAVAGWRLLVGAAGLFALAAWRMGSLRAVAALWRYPLVWVIGVFVASYQALFFIGTSRTGVAIGTLASLALAPFLAGVLGWLLREGAPGWLWAGSTVIAVIGLGLLTLGNDQQISLIGVLAASGAGASYAVYTVVGARLARDGLDATGVLAAAFAIGAVLLLPFVVTGGSWWASANGIVLVLWLGFGATSVAYALFGIGLKHLQPGHVATLNLAEPVVATMLGVIVLGEHLSIRGWVGSLLILIALAVLGLGEVRSTQDEESESIGA